MLFVVLLHFSGTHLFDCYFNEHRRVAFFFNIASFSSNGYGIISRKMFVDLGRNCAILTIRVELFVQVRVYTINEKAKIILNHFSHKAKKKQIIRRMQIASALVLEFKQLKFEQLLEMFSFFYFLRKYKSMWSAYWLTSPTLVRSLLIVQFFLCALERIWMNEKQKEQAKANTNTDRVMALQRAKEFTCHARNRKGKKRFGSSFNAK